MMELVLIVASPRFVLFLCFLLCFGNTVSPQFGPVELDYFD